MRRIGRCCHELAVVLRFGGRFVINAVSLREL
jgi:hypothetical protein